MLVFDFGGVLYGINYLSLRQAITPDRLLGRMTATMRFLTVAMAPLGLARGRRCSPTRIGLRGTLLTVGVLGLAAVRGGGAVVAGATAPCVAGGRRGMSRALRGRARRRRPCAAQRLRMPRGVTRA